MLRRIAAIAGIAILVLLAAVLVWEVWRHASGVRGRSSVETVESAAERIARPAA